MCCCRGAPQASAGEMEARLKPELKAQLEELEAIVEGLEQETALKADVVRQLTESLNRSLAAPSAGKGAVKLDEPSQQEGPCQLCLSQISIVCSGGSCIPSSATAVILLSIALLMIRSAQTL